MTAPPATEFWYQLLHDLIDLVNPTASDIFASPGKLGSLISICRDLESLSKLAEQNAIELCFQKKEIPGYTLVRREGSRFVETGVVTRLLDSLSIREFLQALPLILQAADNISERRYRSLCAAVHREPDLNAIQSNGNSVYLRSNPK
jgi:hypothetical protein